MSDKKFLFEIVDVPEGTALKPMETPDEAEFLAELGVGEEEESTQMLVDSAILGALATDTQDKDYGGLREVLTRAQTSASLGEEVGDMLTVDSFFDEADETLEVPGVEKVKRLEEHRRRLRAMIARMLQNSADAAATRIKKLKKIEEKHHPRVKRSPFSVWHKH